MNQPDLLPTEADMVQKTFVTKNGKANFLCPACGRSKHMDVSKYGDIKKEVRLKCTCACKHVFSVTLERRRHVRKAVNLKGNISFGKLSQPVRIVDVSRLGLKIRAENELVFTVEDKVIVDFVLDDVHHSKVSKEMIVKIIHGKEAGLKFTSGDHYDKFGNYILYHFN